MHDQSGAVLLEWAMVSMGLMIGFLMFVDLANMFNCHLVLSQAAYEGVKTAGSYGGMEAQSATNLAPTPEEVNDCRKGIAPTSGFPCGHYFVQERVKFAFSVARKNTSWSSMLFGSTLTTRFIAPGETGTDTDNSVFVTYSVGFNGFIFRFFPVSATIEGPYMM